MNIKLFEHEKGASARGKIHIITNHKILLFHQKKGIPPAMPDWLERDKIKDSDKYRYMNLWADASIILSKLLKPKNDK